MSYSLYLIHPPMIALCNCWGVQLGLLSAARIAFLLTVGSVASVAAAALFFFAVEKWFLSTSVKRSMPMQPANSTSSASLLGQPVGT
jgi:peptidoglycan/LPS O-acetylase OafA/YrhL